MTDSWESICVVKQVKGKKKQSRNPESMYPNRKWQWEAQMREGESDNQGHRYVVHPAVKYELDKEGENHVNNIR